MSDETKFPLGFCYQEWVFPQDEVEEWFKRCMADRPNPDDYDAASGDDFMLFEQRWYVKWFGQFNEALQMSGKYHYPEQTATYYPNYSIVCNSWYWLWNSIGEKFMKCSLNYNCPINARCGMNTKEES